MKNNWKKVMIVNFLIVLFEIPGMILSYIDHQLHLFEYYTQDSNVILMISCLLYAGYCFYHRGDDEIVIPAWLCRLKYIATCLVTVTFVVVFLVLAPMEAPDGIGAVLDIIGGGSCFFLHLVCPILGISSYLFLEKEPRPKFRDSVLAAIPTLIYATIATTCNGLYLIYGPYPFLHVHEQPVWVSAMWFIVIPFAGFLFALFIRKFAKRPEKI